MNTTETLEAIAQHFNAESRWISGNSIELQASGVTFTVSLFVDSGDEVSIDDKTLAWIESELRLGFDLFEYRSRFKNEALQASGWLSGRSEYRETTEAIPSGIRLRGTRDRVE